VKKCRKSLIFGTFSTTLQNQMQSQAKSYSQPLNEISLLMISRIFVFPANENRPPANLSKKEVAAQLI